MVLKSAFPDKQVLWVEPTAETGLSNSLGVLPITHLMAAIGKTPGVFTSTSTFLVAVPVIALIEDCFMMTFEANRYPDIGYLIQRSSLSVNFDIDYEPKSVAA